MGRSSVQKIVRDQLVAALGEYGELAATYPMLGEVKARIENVVPKSSLKR